MSRVLFFTAFLLGSLLGIPFNASASTVLVLKEGGILEGELLNPDEINRKLYRIKTSEGLEISIAVPLVKKIQPKERPALIEYNNVAPLNKHTLENHLFWAKWCVDNQLADLAKIHWQQVLEFEPENASARAVLGYTKDPKNPTGWILVRERNLDRGYIEHKGRWKTEIQIEVETMLEKKAEQDKFWRKRVQELCRKLPHPQAEAELMSIRDLAGIFQLGEALNNEKSSPQKRQILIRALLQSSNVAAFQIVAAWSVSKNEPSEDIRQMCIEELKKRTANHPEIRPIMLDIYRSCLRKDMPPSIIRMAAQTLEGMEGYEAIPELINVLVIMITETKQPDQQTFTFGGGTTGFGQAGKPITRMIPRQSREALSALQHLSGANFGYDQAAWRNWYRQTLRSPSIDLRRM